MAKEKTVHVIMGNDYPVGVCSNEQLADETIKLLRKEDKKNNIGEVHYKTYPFKVDERFPPVTGELDVTLNTATTG